MPFRCQGLILRRLRFSETSLIVTLFSRHHGRIDALAKGARRAKSPMYGHLDLYSLEEAVIWPRSRSGLDLVTEVDLTHEYVGLRKNAPAFAGAGLLSEITLATCMLNDPHPRLYSALVQGFSLLADGDEIGRSVLLALFRMLSDLGFSPALDRCAECSEEIDATEHNVISGVKGGILCKSCRNEAGGGWQGISPRELAYLRYFAKDSLDQPDRIHINPSDSVNLVEMMGRYMEDVIGKKLECKQLLLDLLHRKDAVR